MIESINEEKLTEDYKASGDKSLFDLSMALSHTHKPEFKELPKRSRQEELMSPMASTCRSKVNYFDDWTKRKEFEIVKKKYEYS